jgi:hypothetical protein
VLWADDWVDDERVPAQVWNAVWGRTDQR